MKLNRQNSRAISAAVNSANGRSKYSRSAVIVLALVSVFSTLSHAKVGAGISGTVTDSSGAIVSGATVQVTATETGIVVTRQTNSDGFYAFVDLQPGHYDIQVSQNGFSTFHQTGILLDVDSAKVVNIKLKVGQISEKVEVSTDAVQLDTASTQLGEVISAQTMTAVPLVTRSYTDLLGSAAWCDSHVFRPGRGSRRTVQRNWIYLHQYFG